MKAQSSLHLSSVKKQTILPSFEFHRLVRKWFYTAVSFLCVLMLYINIKKNQSCWDDFLFSSTKQRIKCLAQRHNTLPAVSLELVSPRPQA